MRPIERGLCPTVIDKAGNTVNKKYTNYDDAKPDLIDRLGQYCSYCEMYLNPPASCHVEHIHAKALPKYSHLIKDWDNFLLSCVHCNGPKGIIDVAVCQPCMPHSHNTFLAFDYTGSMVAISTNLSPSNQVLSQRLMEMVGLDRRPGHTKHSRKDERWRKRFEAHNLANDYLPKFASGSVAVQVIIDLAKAYGFFSIWMAVFHNHPSVRQALINAFTGTAQSCFDKNTVPLNRKGGTVI